ncbi:MAG: zf-HC2 domain-containing protein [Thermoleophilia bacterium]
MTGFSKFATNCERAREWSSLRVDGELPQLQRAMLRKHLAACSGCTAFDSDLAASTAALRTAPMELLERPVVIPRRRRSALRVAPAFAAAAAVAFVFGLGPLAQPHLFRSPAGHTSSIQRAPAGQATAEEKLLHESRVLMRPGIKRGIGLNV